MYSVALLEYTIRDQFYILFDPLCKYTQHCIYYTYIQMDCEDSTLVLPKIHEHHAPHTYHTNGLNKPHTYIRTLPLLYVRMCLHSATYIYIHREEYFCIIIFLSIIVHLYVIVTCYNLLIVLLLQNGWTPLSCALEGGYTEVAKLLISKGAKVSNLHTYNN